MGMSDDFGTRVLIAGLGNPGTEYRDTRHNVGFMVLDRLAARLPKKNFEEIHGCSSHYLKGTYAGKALFLQKPETYMNLSGEAVSSLGGYSMTLDEEYMTLALERATSIPWNPLFKSESEVIL